jgi:hypothetical protein
MNPRPEIAAAALLIAVALLITAGRAGRGRLRALAGSGPPTPTSEPPVLRRQWIVVGSVTVGALGWAVAGTAAGVVAGGLATLAGTLAARMVTSRARPPLATASDLAACWELVAVGLQAGLPVATAVSAAAEHLTGTSGELLRRVGRLLQLGADPAHAWREAERDPELASFARAARRSAGTGAALAAVARAEAERLRSALVDAAQERAQRAAVHITGPLGLCFLPAFLVLGIAPVVVGLAGEALAQW